MFCRIIRQWHDVYTILVIVYCFYFICFSLLAVRVEWFWVPRCVLEMLKCRENFGSSVGIL